MKLHRHSLSDQPDPISHPGAQTPVPRILLVEDHSDTALLLSRLLRGAGHSVQHAEQISDARKLLEAHEFDLIISDLGLPDGSGLDLMRYLQSEKPGLKGICLSGFGGESDVQASREAGFAEHLIKPVDLQRLHAAIRRVTRQRSSALQV